MPLIRPLFSARAAAPLPFLSRARPAVMPLRAKIANPAFSQQMASSTTAADEPDDVLFSSVYGVRTIELNRPKKLNSLNESMIRKITPRLQEWEKSQLANIIVLKGAGDKALCAGGDVATLALANQKGSEGMQDSANFFAMEYQLDHLIATYQKPYVAFMDGITMGGGVGLSVHAPFRIATERTVFAMPETTIGFFPDVGGSFFLSRLDGELGTYLALTSERLKGVHTMYAGIATHYVHSSSLGDLEARLAELTFADTSTLAQRNAIVNSTIEEFVTGLPTEPFPLSGSLRRTIDRTFRFSTIDEILSALHAESTTTTTTTTEPTAESITEPTTEPTTESTAEPTTESTAEPTTESTAEPTTEPTTTTSRSAHPEWAAATIQTLHARSPTSVRVALRALRAGQAWSVAETFQREHAIAAHFMHHPDFVEGVSARLIRKPAATPRWSPAALEDSDEHVTDEFFNVAERAQRRLPLLPRGGGAPEDFFHYPHGFGLPREEEVREVVVRSGARLLPEEVVGYFDHRHHGKKGVKAKVWDVVKRMVVTDENGRCKWKGEV